MEEQKKEEKVLHRKGGLARDKDGSLVLINENKQGYRVDEVIASVWFESDGKSEEELVDTFSKGMEDKKDVIKKDIHLIVSKLKEVKLIE
jgi:hypothetical protein